VRRSDRSLSSAAQGLLDLVEARRPQVPRKRSRSR
jgi:hypothetical protein